MLRIIPRLEKFKMHRVHAIQSGSYNHSGIQQPLLLGAAKIFRRKSASMARIYPFRALRYNLSQVKLQDVVTQPYDKISPAAQQRYYDQSEYSLVRIILGMPELYDDEKNNVYTRAAESLKEWRAKNVLSEEPTPAIFGYAQRYTVPGTAEAGTPEIRERKGFIALGKLQEYADGVVHRHEQTLAKPKSDRMNLLKATRAQCEQIYMLYSDPAFTAEKLIFDGTPPEISVTDEYGVEHKLWRIADPKTIGLLMAAMDDKKLIIADGHHRYETALSYMREHTPAGAAEERTLNTLPQPAFPEAATMMTFVNMDAPGITILPTHRVVFGLKDFSADAFLAKAAKYFDVQPLAEQDAAAVQAKLSEAGKKGVAFVAVTKGKRHLLTAKQAAIDTVLADISPRHRQLDVVQLHSLVLEKLLGLTQESIRQQENLRYLREASDVITQVEAGEANIAFLINPCTLDQLREVAFAREVMPQKSTDFYPKLLSGLVLYAFD
jgi:uncharacterized protein (DUF1015 family)